MEELKKIANKVLGVITQEYLHKLSASIPQKMKAIVDENGGQTNNLEAFSTLECTFLVNKLFIL